MANYPQNIVDAFGGTRAMARVTGYPVATIASWLARGAIRDEHKPAILKAAEYAGVVLSPADFFPTDGGLSTATR